MGIRKIINSKIYLCFLCCYILSAPLLSRLAEAETIGGDSKRDSYIKAIVLFKSEKFAEAEQVFSTLADSNECEYEVKVCALNMAGQVCRISGNYEEALYRFEQLVNFIEGESKIEKKLLLGGLNSKAEIYEYLREYEKAIGKYEKVIALGCDDVYVAKAMDRWAQLNLRMGRVGEFLKGCKVFLDKYKNHKRAGEVELEMLCVKLIKQIDSKYRFETEGFVCCGELVGILNDKGESADKEKIVKSFENIKNKYKDTESSVVINYQYGCVLESLGEDEKALEVYSEMLDKKTSEKIIEYARVRAAILLGEKKEYLKAISVLSKYKYGTSEHLDNISMTVMDSLQVLKREDVGNDN